MASSDSFGARSTLEVGDASYEVFRLDAVEGSADLPYSLKVLLENLLRTEDGANTTADSIRAIAQWDPAAEPDTEIQYTPARVLMQDFTGVPCIVDLATMREAMADLGGDPKRINPLAPAELVIDHSVIADHFGSKDALGLNSALEYDRNRERYEFLKWGQTAFEDFKVVPPETGIVHQVNLERLATVVFTRDAGNGVTSAYPDTLVGTDSHTTMINGLGVLGWGVGGIEAEAAMLGQPVSMLIPKVVGFKLTGELPAGATATDLVLTVTELLRQPGRRRQVRGVLRPGRLERAAGRPRHDRQHEPGVRLDLRHLPGRRRDARLPAPDRPARRDGRARRGVRQGAGHVARPVGRAALLRAGRARPVDRRAVAGRSQAPAGPGAAGRRQGDVPHRAGRLRLAHPRRAGPQARRPPGGHRGRERHGHRRGERRVVPGLRPGRARHLRRRRRTRRGAGVRRRRAPVQPGAGHARRRRPGDHRPRPRRHRGHHVVHQHLQPVRHGRRRPARQERRREGPVEQAVGQDDPRAGLEGRHRLLREGRAHPVPRQARLPDRRLRLHDLHRQQRPAARRRCRPRWTRATWRSCRCCRATATSRGASTRTSR